MRRPSSFRAAALLAAAACLLVTALPAPAAAVGGHEFVAGTNERRASVGLAPVGLSAAADQIAVERAERMAANDAMVHDLTYVQARLNEMGICWLGVGEIIAWEKGYPSYSYDRTLDGWWASPGHRAIMVGDFNGAGGSWAQAPASGAIYSAMIFVKLCQPPPVSTTPVQRIAGPDRYATAAAISAASFGAGVPVAYVATGENFPDAMAGGPLAARARAPLLLVPRDAIPTVVDAELRRLAPGRIVVLGAAAVVSDGVVAALRGYTAGGVTRLAGSDRYATAAAISTHGWPSGAPVAFVATGANFPDALAGGSAAGSLGGPLLLVDQHTVPGPTASELRRLAPGRIVVLGSSAVVSDGVADALRGYTAGGVTRLAGTDRYVTAVAISQAHHAAGEPARVFVATGLDFPDALAAGPVAGMLDGPLLLVPGTSVPDAVAAELRRLAPDVITVLGGPGAVSDAVVDQLRGLGG